MKNNIYCLLCITIISSCTSGEDDSIEQFNLFVQNNTGVAFTLRAVVGDEIITNKQVLTGETSLFCSYDSSFGFIGVACLEEKIEIIFENGTGYTCDESTFVDESINTMCISGLPERAINTVDNDYFITITQEDFNNAFDLPE